MKKRLKLKPFVLPAVYCILVGVLLLTVLLSKNTLKGEKEDNTTYVTGSILDSYVPVINLETTILRPYTKEDITIGKNFYNYDDEQENQTNSIIYYENTYMQNSGVDYIASEVFDVVSILDGEVIEVKKEELLGNIVTIRHDGDIISVYQSLSEVSVQKGEQVTRGQTIGKSGNSELMKELSNHLHFELMLKGQIVDPENYFDKKLSEIE